MKSMKIMSITSYSHGYTGFLEEKGCYVFFQFPRRGSLKKLIRYDKGDYSNYRHFVGGISKFMPRLRFLDEPIPFQPATIQELDNICAKLSGI